MILGMYFGRVFGIETECYPWMWCRQGGRWHEFVTDNGERVESAVEGECAGLSTINDEQRSEVDKLVGGTREGLVPL